MIELNFEKLENVKQFKSKAIFSNLLMKAKYNINAESDPHQ